MILVLALAAAVIAAQAYGQYPLHSDECLPGVTSQSILRGKLHVWLGGNRHYGALKSYLNVPWIALFGPADWTVRATSWVLMLLDVAVVMAGVWLLLGRRAGLAAGAVTAMCPPRLSFWLLGGCAIDVYVFLWYCLPLAVVAAWQRPGAAAPAGFALGFLSGLSQWAAAQAMLVYLPALAAYFLTTSGWVRLAAWPAGFALGSAPWWWDGLTQGFFRDSGSYLGFTGSLASRLSQALANWKFYALTQSYEIFEPSRWPWLALPALVAAGLAVLGGLLAMIWEVRGTERVFWWTWVGGVCVLWLAAIGFTPPGSWREGVHRYALAVFCLLPYLLGLASRKWSDRVLWTVVLALGLPALSDGLWHVLDHRGQRRAQAERAEVRAQIDRVGATYLLGGWWDTGCYTFGYAGRLAALAMAEGSGDPALPINQQLADLVAAPGPGLVILQRGSTLERNLESRGWLEGLPDLPGPASLRLLELPSRPEPGKPGFHLVALADYGRRAQRFVEGLDSTLELSAGLLGSTYTWTPEGSKVFHGRVPGVLVTGPHILLPHGRYRAEFRLACEGSPAAGEVEVLADGSRPLWKQPYRLSPGESATPRGAFELTRDTFVETRVVVGERAGPGDLTVLGVRLARE